MLDVPGAPLLDKDRLIGGCVRLPLAVDAARLLREVEALPASHWGSTGGRVGVHRAAEALFLRGYAPAEGDKPIEDRASLALLPYARELIFERLGAPPLRCLLARLPAGGKIAPHTDLPPYFGKTIRVHVPVATNPQSWMYCAGWVYHMAAGEAWALNNSTIHGVWNAHPTQARTHLICDFLPSAALVAALRDGARDLGRRDVAIEEALRAAAAAPRGERAAR